MDFKINYNNIEEGVDRSLSEAIDEGLNLGIVENSTSVGSYIFCPECGTRQSADSVFCYECGCLLKENVRESPKYNGIIMTDIIKLASKYSCTPQTIVEHLSTFMQESEGNGMYWGLLDVSGEQFKKCDNAWKSYSDALDRFMRENGISPTPSLSLFIIGGHDVVPHPTSENPSGGSDDYDKTIFSDFIYCFGGFPNLDFLDFNKARCNVARLPVESGKMDTTFQSDIVDYLERAMQVQSNGGIKIGRAIMTSNADWIPASREMSRNLPTPHYDDVEGETLDNMFLSPSILEEMSQDLSKKYYSAIGDADMLVFNLHGACAPEDSGFYSNGLAFSIDSLKYSSALIFNTVACWGGRYIRYERKDSMLLNALYNGNVLLYSGACVPALGKCGHFRHDDTWRIQPAAYSETFMARFCEYQCIGKLNAGEAFLKAKCDYYNSSRMVEDDEHILSTVLMFNLYGCPALTTCPDIDVLSEIQEPSGVKNKAIPFRKIKKKTIAEKKSCSSNLSIRDCISMAVDHNLRYIHDTITDRLYHELGLEPRQLSKVEKYESEDISDFNNRGYLYSYDCNIGPVNSKVIAKTDQMGNLISAIQTK